VIRLDPAANKVIVGPKEALARKVIHLKECNWLVDIPQDGIPVGVKFRSIMKPVMARLMSAANGNTEIHLDTPNYGISPGQAAVCYNGDRVLGGGWITGSE